MEEVKQRPDLVIDEEAWRANILTWEAKSWCWDGIVFQTRPDGFFEIIVRDYGDSSQRWLGEKGPYKSRAAAFSAVGSVLDQAAKELAQWKEENEIR